MLSPQDKKELINQLNEANKELRGLRAALNQINDQKEALFSKRVKQGREIVELIRHVKKVRNERNTLTKEVKSSKEKRSDLNNQIKKNVETIKKLNKEKKETAKKFGIKEDPSILKSQMEKINFTIETEGISFSKEQKMMKVLKELKRKYDESKKLSTIWDSCHTLSKELDSLREKADGIHRVIQQKAQLSQEKHETLIDSSKKIDELKKREDALNKQIEEKRKEMDIVSGKLEEKLKVLNPLSEKLQSEKKETRYVKEEKQKNLLKEKQEEVYEKLKRKQKITTEDILILQSAEED